MRRQIRGTQKYMYPTQVNNFVCFLFWGGYPFISVGVGGGGLAFCAVRQMHWIRGVQTFQLPAFHFI